MRRPTGGWGHPPLRRVTINFVGAAVPSGPESPRRFAALPPFTRGAAVTHHQAPLSKADSPYQGEMSRRDKRDRASWHGAAVTEGFRTPVVPLIRHGCAVVGSFAALRMRRAPCGYCAMPPSPLRGEGYSRSVGSAQMSMAFPSSVTAYAVPPSPRGRLF